MDFSKYRAFKGALVAALFGIASGIASAHTFALYSKTISASQNIVGSGTHQFKSSVSYPDTWTCGWSVKGGWSGALTQGAGGWLLSAEWVVEWIPSGPQDVPDTQTIYPVLIDYADMSRVTASCQSDEGSFSWVYYYRPGFVPPWGAYAFGPDYTYDWDGITSFESPLNPVSGGVTFAYDSSKGKWLGSVTYGSSASISWAGSSGSGTLQGVYKVRLFSVDSQAVSTRF
jgi:hypothetical protein